MTKDCMARAVFEQPPVLDVILQNIQHQGDTLPLSMLERDLATLLLVFKAPAAVDVIDAHKIRVMQLSLRRRLFYAQISELTETLPEETQTRHKQLYRILDIMEENKDLVPHSCAIFTPLCWNIHTLLDREECPTFRARTTAYRAELNKKNI